MKHITTIWGIALLISLSLFSCDKDNKHIESSLSEQQEQVQQERNKANTLYTATSEVTSYDVKAEKQEELRASILNTGYHKPTIDVSKPEFDSKNIKAHWAIMGEGKHIEASVSNFLNGIPSKAPKTNSLALYKQNGKRKLMMYSRVDDSFNVANKFAMLTLGGSLRSGRYIDFRGSTAPNRDLQGLKKEQKLQGYQLPIMTDILPFNKIFNKQHTAIYKARGVLIGLSVINNTCKAIDVKRVVLEGNNALWFEGYFDMYWVNGTSLLANSSQGVTTSYRARFVGTRGNQNINCPVYNASAPAYKIDKKFHQTITSAVKEAAPTFYVWGFPRNNSTKFKFKIVYTDYGKTTEKVKTYAIDTPTGGFKEGYAYQLPILLKPTAPIVFDEGNSISLCFKTPLDFLAEVPAINKAENGFITNHNLPSHTGNVGNIQNTNVGYYTWDEAMALFNGSHSFLTDYYLPNRDQWRSIIPKKTVVYTSDTHSKRTFTETAQVGEDPAQDYTSDFITVNEGGIFVTYALRFKGTEWVSAWRYAYATTAKEKFVIKCLPLKDRPNVNSLDLEQDIVNPSLFTTNACTVRTLPMYGRLFDNGEINGVGVKTGFWSRTSRGNYDAFIPRFYGYVVYTNRKGRDNRYPVRPFVRP